MADVEIPKPKVAIRIVIAGIGSFLLAAAGLKAHGFLVDPLSHDSLLGFPRFQIAIIEAEIILGLWLLSGWRMRQAWAVALALFVILASASLYLALDKQNSCG